MLLFGKVPKGTDPALSPSLLPPSVAACTPVLVETTRASQLIPAEMLAQVSLPKVQGQDDVVAIPEPPCSTILSCAVVCLLALGAKSQRACHWPGACLQDFLGLLWCVATTKRHEHDHQSQLEQTFGLRAWFFLAQAPLVCAKHEHEDLFLVFVFCC